jgi:hypothetical protein
MPMKSHKPFANTWEGNEMERHEVIKFVEEKLEESDCLIKSLEAKVPLDSQQKLMWKAEIQENEYWRFILDAVTDYTTNF